MDQRARLDDLQPLGFGPCRQLKADVRLPAGVAPASDDELAEPLLVPIGRKHPPAAVIGIFVKDGAAARLQRRGNMGDGSARLGDERQDPAAPGEIGNVVGEARRCDVLFPNLHVAEAEPLHSGGEGAEEMARPLERKHAAAGPDDLGQIGRRETGAGADVDRRHSRGETGAPPAVEHPRAPHPVLEAEPGHLVVAGAEHVIVVAHPPLQTEFAAAPLADSCGQSASHLTAMPFCRKFLS